MGPGGGCGDGGSWRLAAVVAWVMVMVVIIVLVIVMMILVAVFFVVVAVMVVTCDEGNSDFGGCVVCHGDWSSL